MTLTKRRRHRRRRTSDLIRTYTMNTDAYDLIDHWSRMIGKLNFEEEREKEFSIFLEGWPQLMKTLKTEHILRKVVHYYTAEKETFFAPTCTHTVIQWQLSEKRSKVKTCRLQFPFITTMLLFVKENRVYVAIDVDANLVMLLRPKDSVEMEILATVDNVFAASCLTYIKETKQVLVGGTGLLRVYAFQQGKELSAKLDKIQDIKTSLGKTEFVRKLVVDTISCRIMVLGEFSTVVLDYLTMKEIKMFKDKESGTISCCCRHGSEYLITGSTKGVIKFWNPDLFTEIRAYKGHVSSVSEVASCTVKSLMFSSAEDGWLFIWRLDAFRPPLYRLKVGDTVLRMGITSEVDKISIWCEVRNQVVLYDYNLFYSHFSSLDSTVYKVMRFYGHGDHPNRVMVATEDGGMRHLNPVTGNMIGYMFPMTSLHLVQKFAYSAFRRRSYLVLPEGSVMVLDCSKSPFRSLQVNRAKHSEDSIICIVAVLLSIRSNLEDVAVLIGLRSGQIHLLSSDTFMMPRPIQAHHTEVCHLDMVTEVSADGTQVYRSARFLLSVGSDCLVKFWDIRCRPDPVHGLELRLTLLMQIRCSHVPDFVTATYDRICLVYEGMFLVDMYKILLDDAVYAARAVLERPVNLRHTPDYDHIATITALDKCVLLRIFITASKDRTIKIWDDQNELLRELIFLWPVVDSCFVTDSGHLLAAFESVLVACSPDKYLPFDELERLSLKEFQDMEQREMSMKYEVSLKSWIDARTLKRKGLYEKPSTTATASGEIVRQDFQLEWSGDHEKETHMTIPVFILKSRLQRQQATSQQESSDDLQWREQLQATNLRKNISLMLPAAASTVSAKFTLLKQYGESEEEIAKEGEPPDVKRKGRLKGKFVPAKVVLEARQHNERIRKKLTDDSRLLLENLGIISALPQKYAILQKRQKDSNYYSAFADMFSPEGSETSFSFDDIESSSSESAEEMDSARLNLESFTRESSSEAIVQPEEPPVTWKEKQKKTSTLRAYMERRGYRFDLDNPDYKALDQIISGTDLSSSLDSVEKLFLASFARKPRDEAEETAHIEWSNLANVALREAFKKTKPLMYSEPLPEKKDDKADKKGIFDKTERKEPPKKTDIRRPRSAKEAESIGETPEASEESMAAEEAATEKVGKKSGKKGKKKTGAMLPQLAKAKAAFISRKGLGKAPPKEAKDKYKIYTMIKKRRPSDLNIRTLRKILDDLREQTWFEKNVPDDLISTFDAWVDLFEKGAPFPHLQELVKFTETVLQREDLTPELLEALVEPLRDKLSGLPLQAFFTLLTLVAETEEDRQQLMSELLKHPDAEMRIKAGEMIKRMGIKVVRKSLMQIYNLEKEELNATDAESSTLLHLLYKLREKPWFPCYVPPDLASTFAGWLALICKDSDLHTLRSTIKFTDGALGHEDLPEDPRKKLVEAACSLVRSMSAEDVLGLLPHMTNFLNESTFLYALKNHKDPSVQAKGEEALKKILPQTKAAEVKLPKPAKKTKSPGKKMEDKTPKLVIDKAAELAQAEEEVPRHMSELFEFAYKSGSLDELVYKRAKAMLEATSAQAELASHIPPQEAAGEERKAEREQDEEKIQQEVQKDQTFVPMISVRKKDRRRTMSIAQRSKEIAREFIARTRARVQLTRALKKQLPVVKIGMQMSHQRFLGLLSMVRNRGKAAGGARRMTITRKEYYDSKARYMDWMKKRPLVGKPPSISEKGERASLTSPISVEATSAMIVSKIPRPVPTPTTDVDSRSDLEGAGEATVSPPFKVVSIKEAERKVVRPRPSSSEGQRPVSPQSFLSLLTTSQIVSPFSDSSYVSSSETPVGEESAVEVPSEKPEHKIPQIRFAETDAMMDSLDDQKKPISPKLGKFPSERRHLAFADASPVRLDMSKFKLRGLEEESTEQAMVKRRKWEYLMRKYIPSQHISVGRQGESAKLEDEDYMYVEPHLERQGRRWRAVWYERRPDQMQKPIEEEKSQEPFMWQQIPDGRTTREPETITQREYEPLVIQQQKDFKQDMKKVRVSEPDRYQPDLKVHIKQLPTHMSTRQALKQLWEMSHWTPGEAGLRVARSVAVYKEQPPSSDRPIPIKALKGRAGMATADSQYGQTNYGKIGLQWTTRVPSVPVQGLERRMKDLQKDRYLARNWISRTQMHGADRTSVAYPNFVSTSAPDKTLKLPRLSPKYKSSREKSLKSVATMLRYSSLFLLPNSIAGEVLRHL